MEYHENFDAYFEALPAYVSREAIERAMKKTVEAVMKVGTAYLRERMETVVENLYQRVSRGDMGRSDIRQCVEAVLLDCEALGY
jgi:ribosome-associated toxin RatA of RatAB toxin-antitoxin module